MKLIVEFSDTDDLNCIAGAVQWYVKTPNYTENRSTYMSSAVIEYQDGTVSIHKLPSGTIKAYTYDQPNQEDIEKGSNG